ncbi:MAG: hypothetical protein IKQ27_11090 [Lachnospiraceae bacterium]|nr:hypothetical protein [Lachnospiraceae bacterium]MBR6157493.1 hypothetical protein [Lachnospiraceae bacterium]
MMRNECLACNKSPLDKDTVGINKKLIGRDVKTFYCLDCLADYLGCSVEDIMEKIEEFKEEGCELFK